MFGSSITVKPIQFNAQIERKYKKSLHDVAQTLIQNVIEYLDRKVQFKVPNRSEISQCNNDSIIDYL